MSVRKRTVYYVRCDTEGCETCHCRVSHQTNGPPRQEGCYATIEQSLGDAMWDGWEIEADYQYCPTCRRERAKNNV